MEFLAKIGATIFVISLTLCILNPIFVAPTVLGAVIFALGMIWD